MKLCFTYIKRNRITFSSRKNLFQEIKFSIFDTISLNIFQFKILFYPIIRKLYLRKRKFIEIERQFSVKNSLTLHQKMKKYLNIINASTLEIFEIFVLK